MTSGATLPPYTVRVSHKARRVRLTVSPREGLVVVVPAGMKVDVAAIVESKRAWAERALSRVRSRQAELSLGTEALLPDFIDLPGIGLRTPVEYRHTARAGVSARSARGLLVVSGDVDDADACLDALRRWLSRTASVELPNRVTALAAQHGLAPSSVRIGGAKTRWGSCSARGTISLSRNSVFLPAHLLDALILHELAHLRVLDHSQRFWATLTEMDAGAIRHRKELKRADDLVPAWAFV